MLSIAQPLFDQFGRNPTFFVAHRASSTTIWLLTLGVFLIPGLVAAALSLGIAALHRRIGWVVHCTLVGLLTALVFLPLFNRASGQRTALALAAAALAAVAVGALYGRAERLRPFFGYLGAFTVVILGLFVGNSGVTALLFEDDVAVSANGGNETSVVLIVFDELPIAGLLDADQQLDPTRAPNLVGFANDTATWYPDTTTVSARTQWAVPSILTGNDANLAAAPTAAQHPQNLFTETAGSHDMLVAETITRLCPEAACAERGIGEAVDDATGNILSDTRVLYLHTVLPAGLADRWLPPINTGWTGFGLTSDDDGDGPADDAGDVAVAPEELADATSFDWLDGDLRQDQRLRFEQFIDALSENDGPTVSYGHVLLPHAPWRYLPDGTLYNGDTIPGLGSGSEDWEGRPALLEQATHRFLLQTGFTDALLGRVFDELKASGQFDDSLIIVTADHGTSFVLDTNRREVQAGTEADIAMVPLFVKYPGQTEGLVDDTEVQTIDIFPTIAEVLDLELTDAVDGVSLLAQDRPDRVRGLQTYTPIDDLDSRLDLDQAIERITAVVPSGVRPDEVWGSQSVRGIVGLPVADIAQSDLAASFELAPPNASTYNQIDRSTGYLPIRYVASVVAGEAPDGVAVAVAFNGVIAGGNELFDGQLSVLVDPRLIEDGANVVALYAYVDEALTPITVKADLPYLIDSDDNGIVAISTEGRVWDQPNTADRYRGFASTPEPRTAGRTPPIRGWAADTENGDAAEAILVVAGGEVVLSQAIRTQRQDVVDVSGDDRLLDSGWSFNLTPDQFAADPIAVALFPDGTFHVMVPVQRDGE